MRREKRQEWKSFAWISWMNNFLWFSLFPFLRLPAMLVHVKYYCDLLLRTPTQYSPVLSCTSPSTSTTPRYLYIITYICHIHTFMYRAKPSQVRILELNKVSRLNLIYRRRSCKSCTVQTVLCIIHYTGFYITAHSISMEKG